MNQISYLFKIKNRAKRYRRYVSILGNVEFMMEFIVVTRRVQNVLPPGVCDGIDNIPDSRRIVVILGLFDNEAWIGVSLYEVVY